jgi:hypothetical protein
MKVLILLSLILSLSSNADEILSEEYFIGQGSMNLQCSRNEEIVSRQPLKLKYHNSILLLSEIELVSFGEGKIRVNIFKQENENYGHYKVNDYSFSFIGLDNGMGGYDLYSATNSSLGKRIAELVILKSMTVITFVEDTINVTQVPQDYYYHDCHILKSTSHKFSSLKRKKIK